ncbi:hypothetical protein CFAM422_006556 [Trichoderma lentiforme]|uniref:Uncharacterized protein n=1 Tax=Trichoderma lentiforme TaxID=1567552 RepID=A0A9P5CBN2_9HYPO|nr:hypothetical protein CFAM422_006556 [Trichoderma lentiforme]
MLMAMPSSIPTPRAMVAQRQLLCANTLATSASIRPTSKGISTAIAKEAKAHLAKEAKAHLAKEAKAHGSANTGANDKTEAAVVFEYSCDLCGFSTNVKKKFGRHNATQAHRAREAEARLNATGDIDINADVDAKAAIVDKSYCSLYDYLADREKTLVSVTSGVPII